MSLAGNFELTLFLNTFRNVDLFRQGLYYFSLRIYSHHSAVPSIPLENPEDTPVLETPLNYAVPYQIIDTPHIDFERGGLLTPLQREGRSAHTDEEHSFNTRIFRVQFCDQTVILREGCVFRLQQELGKACWLYLEADLMFKEFHSSEYSSEVSLPSFDSFEAVSRKRYRIRGLFEGLHSYHPIKMDDNHFCSVDLLMHTTLLTFHTHFEEQTIVEAFTKLSRDKIDKLHAYYILSLVYAYNTLAKEYQKLLEKCWLPNSYPDASDKFLVEELVWEEAMIKTPTASKVRFTLPKLENLSTRLAEDETEVLVKELVKDIHFVSAQILGLWQKFQTLTKLSSDTIIAFLKPEWETKTIEHWGSCIFRETLKVDDRYSVMDGDVSRMHSRVFHSVRKTKNHLFEASALPIEDESLTLKENSLAVVFEQTYNAVDGEESRGKPSEFEVRTEKNSDMAWGTKHVIVLMHGYQGNSWDMRIFKNYLNTVVPPAETLFLLSTSNEKDTECDIESMGKRLAREVDEFIEENCGIDGIRMRKLSFVVHSLGGIIVRSALCDARMSPYLQKCYTLFSLGSPHCGYLYSSNWLISVGIWTLRKWSQSTCLNQLSLTDTANPRDSYMYHLSKKKGLEYFQNVLLVSSPEDKYAPYHSARIELHQACLKDPKWGSVYQEMVLNLLKPLEQTNVTRFDICFTNDNMGLDYMIGRAAHIFFLDRPIYILMLVIVYKHYFQ